MDINAGDLATQTHTLHLRDGERWAWFDDLRILGLDASLDEAGRAEAVDDFIAHSRAELQRISAQAA